MKINPMLNAVNFLNLTKSDGTRQSGRSHKDGENGRDQYTRQEKQSGDSEDGQGENESSFARQRKMNEAVEAFQEDPLTQASGLSAATEGQGPGLRVVVKDSSGGVVRQFTGEEFLKLREAVSQEQKSRGKILDQKV